MVLVHAVSHSSTAIFSLKLIWGQNCSIKDTWAPGVRCLKTMLNTGCTIIPWHLFQFWFIVLFNKLCTKYQDLSISPTFVVFIYYFTFPPPVRLCFTAFPLTDLSTVIFSIVEVAEFLLVFALLFMCLFFFLDSLLLMSLLKKEFRAAEVTGEAASLCCSWYSQSFVGILTFHTYFFLLLCRQIPSLNCTKWPSLFFHLVK